MTSALTLLAKAAPAHSSSIQKKSIESGGFNQFLRNVKGMIESDLKDTAIAPKELEKLIKGLRSLSLQSAADEKQLLSEVGNFEKLASFIQALKVQLSSNVESQQIKGLENLMNLGAYLKQSKASEEENSELLLLIEEAIAHLTINQGLSFPKSNEFRSNNAITNVIAGVSKMEKSNSRQPGPDNDAMINQLERLWNKFQQGVEQLTQQLATAPKSQPDSQSNLALKQVLVEMNKILKQFPDVGKQQLEQVMKQGSKAEQQLFNEVMRSFQNRHNIPHTYHQQLPVKSSDIGKWITQIVEKQQTDTLVKTAPSLHTMQMTKIEQHVLHVNQNQSSSSMQKQLIQEFERVLNNSRMFLNKSGGMEMQLKLRPANLGDMMVKMIQVNGEMAVKILVSSQAAKDMLEGNMTQLRHMFSPQQVLIEKQENMFNQHSLMRDSERSEEQFEDGQRDRSNHEEERHGNADEDEEFSFHDLLMNEKV